MANRATTGNHQGLTHLEERFCIEYVQDLNGGRAVIRAGYKVKDIYSASVQANRMLKKAKIRAYLKDVLHLNEITIISEIVRIALAKITDVCEFDGDNLTVLPTSQWSEGSKSAVKSLKITKTTTTRREGNVVTEITSVTSEIKMHDKLAALEKLLRKFGMTNRQIALLDAVQVLLQEGVATPEQAQIISDGVNSIQQKIAEYGIKRA